MRQGAAAEQIEKRGDTPRRLGVGDVAKPFAQNFRIDSRSGDRRPARMITIIASVKSTRWRNSGILKMLVNAEIISLAGANSKNGRLYFCAFRSAPCAWPYGDRCRPPSRSFPWRRR